MCSQEECLQVFKELEKCRKKCLILEKMFSLLNPFLRKIIENKKQNLISDKTLTQLSVLKIKLKLINNKNDFQINKNNKNNNKLIIIRKEEEEDGEQEEEQHPDTNKKNRRNRTKNLLCQWPGCEQRFRDRHDLQNHMWRHTGEKLYRCDWPGCQKEFSSKCYQLKHEKSHSDPNPYKCDFQECASEFADTTSLSDHYNEKHNGQKPYPCDWPGCDKRSNVLKHMKKSHLNRRQYRCPIANCSALFSDSRELIVHKVNQHNQEKPFHCDWPGCEFGTCYPQKLTIHKERHTGEKRYECFWPQCDSNGFRQKCHLKAHMLKHTGEKPFPCLDPNCDRKFQANKAMRFHMSRHHQKHFQN